MKAIMEEIQEEDVLSEAKRNILLAASESFAEHGFRHGTTRDIAKRANVNIGAINYHFGTKEQLYFFVLNYWKKKVLKKYPVEPLKNTSIPAGERLRLFIQRIFYVFMDDEGAPWLSKLLTREVVVEHTSAFEPMLKYEIKFIFDMLIDILSDLFEEHVKKGHLKLCAMSIIGQCAFFCNSLRISELVYAEEKEIDFNDIERLVEHIYRFSMTAIQAYRMV